MKIIGCILIFLSSLLSSYYYERNLKKKTENLEELVSLITFIKNKIEYFSVPINKIFAQYSTNNQFIKNLITNKATNDSFFDKETKNQINSFILNIGSGFKKEQIALCDYNVVLFNQRLSKIKNETPNKIKVFRALALFVGISIIILLV